MTHYTLEEAKEHLSDLLDKVRQGETVVIDDVPIVHQEIDPKYPKGKRILGTYKGQVRMRADFDEPIEGMEEYTE